MGPTWNKDSGADSQTDLYNQSLVSSVVQAKLLACCYGFMSEFVTSVGRHYSALIQYETNSQQLLQESGRCNLREKTSPLGLRGTQRRVLKNICSEDDLRSRIFGTFVVKFLA